MAATGSAVISGHCVASLPAASSLGDKACDWASLALCACGDVGEAPTGRVPRPPCVPGEGSWAIWGPEHWGCDPVPGAASGQSSGRVAWAGSGAGWSLGWAWADGKAHGLLSSHVLR